MTLKLLLFASLKDAVGKSSIDVNVEAPAEGATVADVLTACGEQFPRLAAWLPHVRVAVNQQYVNLSDAVPAGSEVALIPPVSGGCQVKICKTALTQAA